MGVLVLLVLALKLAATALLFRIVSLFANREVIPFVNGCPLLLSRADNGNILQIKAGFS